MDKNLIQRLITGTIFVLVLVGGLMWSLWSFAGLFLLIIILGLWEFYGLAQKAGFFPQKLLGTIVGALIFIFLFLVELFYFSHMPILHSERMMEALLLLIGAIIFCTPFLIFFIELFRKKEAPFTNIGFTILGWLYIAVPFSLWNLVLIDTHVHRELESLFVPETTYKWHLILGFFILMWTSDSMAYVCGRLLGKHKLFERISPKKTWEGFIGGVLFAALAGYILSFFYLELDALHWMIMAVLVSVTGMFGDLVESMFKRSIGVKDSGKLLPGHGGILDRFDAVLLASPFVVLYLTIFAVRH